MKTSISSFAACLLGASCVALVACSSTPDEPVESLRSARGALYSLEDPTTIVPGTPSTRTASCPGRKLPDQCGTWAGVELSASRSYWPPRDAEGEHCLCQAIDFQIPASIPVTRGNAGIQLAELEFRRTNGRVTHCFYQGDQRLSRGKLVGGSEYDLQLCTDGSKAGAAAKADWFSLELKGGNPLNGPTEVQLRLGEPDVVGGVVQEQIFYSDDPRIPGAALHVPRGSAPALQSFSLEVLPQVTVGSTIENGGAALRTAGYAVDVRADGVDDFVFTPVPGAACPRIELPYNPATLAATAGPNAEARLLARQITDLGGIGAGGKVLVPTGPLSVDPVKRTVSFCVEHLSYYVAGTNATDGNLTGAYIAEGAPVACTGTGQSTCGTGKVCVAAGCYVNVLSTPPPPLKPSTEYTLRLEFTNEVALPWARADLKLTSVRPREGSNTPTPLTGSPWFPELGTTTFYEQSYAGTTNVGQGIVAAFVVPVTTPRQETPYAPYEFGSLLNLCLRTGTSATAWISECFSWDPGLHPTTTSGTGVGPLAESCDDIDNDNNGIVDDGINACLGVCGLNPPRGTSCNNGEQGVCFVSGEFVCDGRNRTRCSAGSGAANARPEICGNGLDDDCNGVPDDGDCCSPGATRCVGTNGTSKQSCGTDGRWADNGIVVGECGADCSGPVSCGACGKGAVACDAGKSSGVCAGDDAQVEYFPDADEDTWCSRASITTCPDSRPERTRTRAECSDSTWGFRPDCLDSNPNAQNGCCERQLYSESYYKQCCGAPEIKTYEYDCGAGWHVQSCTLTRIEGFGKTSSHFLIMPGSCPIGSQTGTLDIEYGLNLFEGVEGFGVVHCIPDGFDVQPAYCPVL